MYAIAKYFPPAVRQEMASRHYAPNSLRINPRYYDAATHTAFCPLGVGLQLLLQPADLTRWTYIPGVPGELTATNMLARRYPRRKRELIYAAVAEFIKDFDCGEIADLYDALGVPHD